MIDDLFPDTRSIIDFYGFPACKRVESSNSDDDSASEANTGSHDEIQTSGLDDVDAAAAYQTHLNPAVSKTYRDYDHTVDALGGLNNLPQGSRLRSWTPVDLPSMKAFCSF